MPRPTDPTALSEREQCQRELDAKLRDMDRVPVPPESYPFITMYEACALARCSRETIEKATRNGRLRNALTNHEYRGRRFARVDVVEWIQNGMPTKPAQPQPAAAE
jgi:excisionase family DNA binding protein